MVFQCINIRQVPWEVLKTAASGLGFQHLSRDLVIVNAWKAMFDPYIVIALIGKRELVALVFFGLWLVYCLSGIVCSSSWCHWLAMFCDCVSSWTSYIPLGITKTRLFKTIQNFFTKNWKFSDKNSDLFHISAQNIDCGYSLEPPHQKHGLCTPNNRLVEAVLTSTPQSMFWAEIWIISNIFGPFGS